MRFWLWLNIRLLFTSLDSTKYNQVRSRFNIIEWVKLIRHTHTHKNMKMRLYTNIAVDIQSFNKFLATIGINNTLNWMIWTNVFPIKWPKLLPSKQTSPTTMTLQVLWKRSSHPYNERNQTLIHLLSWVKWASNYFLVIDTHFFPCYQIESNGAKKLMIEYAIFIVLVLRLLRERGK